MWSVGVMWGQRVVSWCDVWSVGVMWSQRVLGVVGASVCLAGVIGGQCVCSVGVVRASVLS